MFPSESIKHNIGRKTFYFRRDAVAGNATWLLFDSFAYLSTTPQGPDLTWGSSWGIPQGTIPANSINQILNSLPGFNPFFLEKITVHYTTRNSLVGEKRPPIIRPEIFYIKSGGSQDFQLTDRTTPQRSDLQQDEYYEYPVNKLIDGNQIIVIGIGTLNAYQVNFHVNFQKLQYAY